jgi:4-hydroxybenzoate polyprenyltransferase
MKQLLLTSRPRFWMYTAGPYLLGITAAGFWQSFEQVWLIALFALFFIFPANLFIYGVNDIFDGDTDALNDKKQGYETQSTNPQSLISNLLILNLPFLLLLPFLTTNSIIVLGAFLFFSFFYSAKPIRAKAIPFLDAGFNVLYVLPGVFAYFLAGGNAFDPMILLAGWAWCIAMHVYSAVPDIEPDTKAGIKTTATVLGKDMALLYCLFFYLSAAALSFAYLGSFAILLALVYTSMIVWSISKDTAEKVLDVYRWFPYVNGVVGMLLFFFVYFY